MVKVWVSVDDNGHIVTANTTNPERIPGENVPEFHYTFELTWAEIEELWKYKVSDRELVLINA